ncbi:histidine kinase N-terminal 7TM domain-containing diguanylate cyclase [Kineococcus sp. SYSU DK003]|uniref:histidine kinase N-terminal 7TM domain-containing diguanylate cyclase n=1 Tax=Kineococcus sp. SYSU DK003 TaxID=3383124 RepID=UPI003D7D7631
MTTLSTAFCVAFAVAAVLNVLTAAVAWRHRHATPAATALAAVAAGLALWAGVGAPLNFPVPQQLHDALLYLSFVGVLGSVVGLHLLAHFAADPQYRPGRLHVVHLVVVPLLLLAAVGTDHWHHLVLTDIEPLDRWPWYGNRFGPLFWVHTAWCYTLLALAYLRLGRAWLRGSPVVRRQVGTLTVAGLVPLAGNLVVISRPDLFSGHDLTPLFFTVTAVLDARAVLRGTLLRVVPVARARVLETVQDIIVVVDDGGVVVDVNPAGRAMLRQSRPDLPADPVGLPARDFISSRALGALPGGRIGYVLDSPTGQHFDVQVSAIEDARGRSLGRVVVGRDITELVEARRRLEEQAAVADRLRAQLAEDAVRDPLTGLHNRRHFDPAAAELLGAVDGHHPVGVLVVDIDHFKRVNDTHGHAAGDQVLVALARELQNLTRQGDLVARTGGEEFVLVLPGADAAVVARRAEELRTRCAQLEVPVVTGTVRPTVSIGTALAPRDGDDVATVLAAADQALYRAKADGRNRVAAA